MRITINLPTCLALLLFWRSRSKFVVARSNALSNLDVLPPVYGIESIVSKTSFSVLPFIKSKPKAILALSLYVIAATCVPSPLTLNNGSRTFAKFRTFKKFFSPTFAESSRMSIKSTLSGHTKKWKSVKQYDHNRAFHGK